MQSRARTFLRTFTIASALLTCLWLSQASAQGMYKNSKYSKADVDFIIQRVEAQSNVFTGQFDRALDRSRLDGTMREDRLNDQVKQMARTLDTLRNEFNRRESWWETRSNVQDVLNQTDEVNRLMRNRKLGREVEDSWRTMRADLNKLAGVYELPRLK